MRSIGAAAVTAWVLAAGAVPDAQASPDTFRHGLANVVSSVGDVVFGPWNAGVAVYENLDRIGDAWWQKAIYPLPGYVGLLGLEWGQAALRAGVGAVELTAGVFVFPVPGTDLPEAFNPFRLGDPAVVEWQNPLAHDWVRWIPFVTPVTIDGRMGPLCPWAIYDDKYMTGAPSYVHSESRAEPSAESSAE